MGIHHTGIYLTPLCSWEAAEQCAIDGIGIGHLGVEESRFERWDHQELAILLLHFLF